MDWIEFRYVRTPGKGKVQRNDILEFNYPADDIYPDDPALGKIKVANRKRNYIKPCVRIPGDLLKIRYGELIINGKTTWKSPHQQFEYQVMTKVPFSRRWLDECGFRYTQGYSNPNDNVRLSSKGYYIF